MTDPAPLVDPELMRLADELVARVRAGETLGIALVEVKRAGVVTCVAEGRGVYHDLHSGVARLAVQLALQDD